MSESNSDRRPFRPVALIALLIALGAAVVSGAYALNSGDSGTVSSSDIRVPAEDGAPAGLPLNAEARVDVDSLEFLGTGPGGIRVWKGAGANEARGLDCYVTAGTAAGIPLSGVDCDTTEAYAERGLTIAGGTSSEGRFVGYAVVSGGLTGVEVDGRRLTTNKGVAFFDLSPGARQLSGTGGDRAIQVDLSRFTRPIE